MDGKTISFFFITHPNLLNMSMHQVVKSTEGCTQSNLERKTKKLQRIPESHVSQRVQKRRGYTARLPNLLVVMLYNSRYSAIEIKINTSNEELFVSKTFIMQYDIVLKNSSDKRIMHPICLFQK